MRELARWICHSQQANNVRRSELCQEHHTEIIDTLRTLMGGVPLQMPADSSLLDEPALKDVFQRWWGTPAVEAEIA